VTEPASRPSFATFFVDWIPAVATGAAFFMIVLDTSTVKMALAAYKAARRWSRTPLYSVI
jgi:hypothetical protein